MEEKEIKEQAYNFAEKLRQVVSNYGFTTNAIHLIFLKYLTEYDNVKTPEQFKILMSFKNMFIDKTFSKKAVYDTLKIINDIYRIEGDVLLDSLDIYCFIFQNEEKNNLIFKILNEFNLPKDIYDRKCFLNQFLNFSYSDINKSLVFTMNESLCKLANSILNVDKNETYLDCYCGYFRSALFINAHNYLGQENNIYIGNSANMIMIMLERFNFYIKSEIFIYEKDKEFADKIFCDALNGLKICEFDLENVSKISLYLDNFEKIINCLNENGLAVIAVPSKVLTNNYYEQLREGFTKSKLKAVITLPPLWTGAYENTSLLILEKNKKINDVIMIDASSDEYFNKVNKKNNQLKDETIIKIIDALNGHIIEGFSKCIKERDILNNNDTSWHPQTYIKKKKDVEFRSSIEIENELNKVYKELSELLK